MKFFGGVGLGRWKSQLDFGADPLRILSWIFDHFFHDSSSLRDWTSLSVNALMYATQPQPGPKKNPFLCPDGRVATGEGRLAQ